MRKKRELLNREKEVKSKSLNVLTSYLGPAQ